MPLGLHGRIERLKLLLQLTSLYVQFLCFAREFFVLRQYLFQFGHLFCLFHLELLNFLGTFSSLSVLVLPGLPKLLLNIAHVLEALSVN